jgi:hypothetical protein
MEFQVKLIENLISKYHTTEARPLGRPPSTRMNVPNYPTYIVATIVKAKSVSVLCCVLQNGSMSVCCSLFPMLPYGGQLLEGERGGRVNMWLKNV